MLLGGCVEGPSTGAAACERPPCLNINLNVVKSCKVDTIPSSQVEKRLFADEHG